MYFRFLFDVYIFAMRHKQKQIANNGAPSALKPDNFSIERNYLNLKQLSA